MKRIVTVTMAALAATLALLSTLLAGCAVSSETTGGQLNQIKPGMSREQVVDSLGDPARTDLENGAPSEDLYVCDEQGEIMVVKVSQLAMAAETPIFPLFLVDSVKLNNLSKRARECAIHYDQGRVVSTSEKNGLVLTR
jgi:hypothetical protein